MGAVLVLTPVVVAAWPIFATAVVSAATSLGYAAAASAAGSRNSTRKTSNQSDALQLEVPHSDIVAGQLGRDEQLSVTRDGVTITFRRDERGKASLSVSGAGRSHDELRALGEEMSQRVVRDYVHQQIVSEALARDFNIIHQSVDDDNTIRLTVRHWEN